MKNDILTWTDGLFDGLTFEVAENVEDAVFLLEKFRKDFVWNILRGFEGIPATLPQTSAILDGYSVEGLGIRDLLKIKRYGDGVALLCDMVRSGDFSVHKHVACALHSVVAKDEVRDDQRGRFRTVDVSLRNVSYAPPHPVALNDLWTEDLFAETSISFERASAVFFAMSRAQFFHDANKRTAMLMMNGILMSAGLKPFFIPEAKKGRFSFLLAEFYETGNADKAMEFFGSIAHQDETESPTP